MAKKGKKGKGKKSAGGDGEKTPRPGKEEPLSVMESIMSFQKEVREKTTEAFRDEIINLKHENKECKAQTVRLQAEQLAYVKQSMKAAKDFDSDYQNTIMELHDDIEQALGSRKNGITDKQIEEQAVQDQVAKVQAKIDDIHKNKAQLLDYKENGSVLHKKSIDVLKSTIDALNHSFDENSKYIQKNLALTLDEISKATESKVDSQKYQATDRAIQLLDPRNYTVAQQNAWLKSEVSLLRRDIERLWKEVEHLETDNISMLTDMYDERMMDIKRSRQHYLDCVKKGALLGADREVMVKEESEEEPEDSDEDGEEIELTEGELQLLSIQGAKKPLYDRPPEVEDDCCLIAVSSFEWTLDEKATVSLTTL